MIKVKHYSHQYRDCHPTYSLIKEFPPTNTDTSKWRPDLSIARAQINSTSSKYNFLYDFQDGKDTGDTVQTFLRSKSLDITEVETAEKRVTQIIERKNAEDQSQLDSEAKRKQGLQDLADGIANAMTPSTPSE